MRAILARIGSYCLLVLCALVFLAPICFMLSASLTANERVFAVLHDGLWHAFLPAEPTLDNYREILATRDAEHGFLFFLRNSLIVTGATVLAGLLVNSMAGYALARLRFAGRGALLAVLLALLVIPFEAIAVPLFFLTTSMGWYNSFHVQIVPFIANPFSIYLFYTFFNALPRELEEAARVDGASSLRIFAQIAVPLALPAFATVAILSFLMHWGSYLWPLMATSTEHYRPLPVAIGAYAGQRPAQWGEVMAFGTLMVLPVLIVFLVFQRAFVRGIAAGGLKG